MTFDELLQMDGPDQVAYLNGEVESGKSVDDVLSAIGTDRSQINKNGIFLVMGKKFMVKPMRGYQTTKLTGNETLSDAKLMTAKVKK